MSNVPEWMLKFQQIGQKGGEEVTSFDEKGASKFVNKDRETPANTAGGTSVAGSSVSSATFPPPLRAESSFPPPLKAESSKEEPSKDEAKKEEGDDDGDDAAALFYNAGRIDEDDPDDEPGQINSQKAGAARPDDDPSQMSDRESAVEASKEEESKTSEEEETKIDEVVDTAATAAAAAAAQEEYSKKSVKDKAAMFSALEGEYAAAPISDGDTPIDADQQQSAGEADSALSLEEDDFTTAASASVMQSETGDTATEGENVMSANDTTTATPEGEDGAGVVGPLGAPSDEEMLLDDEEEIWEDELEEEVIDEDVYVDENGYIIEEDLDENGNEVVVEDEVDPLDTLPSAASMFGTKAQDPPADTFDIEKQDEAIEKVPKEKKPTKFNPYIAICACLAVIAAVVVVVLYIILDIDEEDTPREVSAVPPPPTPSPTITPSVILDPAIENPDAGVVASDATTSFDPMISDGCDFTGLAQPNISDQCRCGEQIIFLAEDVRTRYSDLVKNFIPSVPGGYDGTISSCIPRNQALVWLSAGVNNGGENESARIQRFAMAEFFYEQGGLTWTDSTSWLSARNVCSWYGITCNVDSVISKIELGGNNLTGQVSAFSAHI